MGNALQDLRFGTRLLWKDKGFTTTTLLTLVVCIGANAVIFAVVHSVLLRPLPFPESDRVILVYNSYPRAGVVEGASSAPDYYDRRREVPAFRELAMYEDRAMTLGGEGPAWRVESASVTPSFFPLLRARTLRGRLFRPEEGEIGGEHKVILSYALWQKLFAGSDAAIGKDLRLDGVPHAIVGVMPRDFLDDRLARKFWPGMEPIGRRVWEPEDAQHLAPGPKTRYVTVVDVVETVKLTGLVESDPRLGSYYRPFAQSPRHRFTLAVRSSGDPRRLAAALRGVVAAIDPEIPLFGVETMDERTEVALVSRRFPMLLALGFAAVALFLSAVGVYGVLAYQVAQRQREIGVRMALGGTRRAISGLVLAESGRMFALGLGLGLAGVFAAGRGMRSLLYEVQPADPAVLAAVALTLSAVALTAALIPAQRAQDVDPAVALAAS